MVIQTKILDCIKLLKMVTQINEEFWEYLKTMFKFTNYELLRLTLFIYQFYFLIKKNYQFPLDLSSVERDHTFLDADSLQALFRRLRVLNRCAKIRLDSSDKKSNVEDSEDDEEECALSGNWTFEKQSRRWSRIDPSQFPLHARGDLRPCDSNLNNESEEYSREQFKRSGSERLKDGAKAFLRRMESIKNKKKKRHREGIVISSPERYLNRAMYK
ncbi:StAR-related lipid transfer protein 13 [Armadillidium nasatum]|uniref:StAR-related lipid transfer protein 13 n=1 Tax=Armadillidium nasatum TaxID=96803 RepID=A0A5N5STX3_9CRUS|nr:StAR-related lipid transfer protein 13 [Armadillidium nasatum]